MGRIYTKLLKSESIYWESVFINLLLSISISKFGITKFEGSCDKRHSYTASVVWFGH